ncbi:SH3-like domain-containing protein [Streptomyces sp. NPDC002078]
MRAKPVSVSGHTRLPGCVRAHTGVVEVVQPAAVLPHIYVQHLSENPQHVCSAWARASRGAPTLNPSHSPWSRTTARAR